MYRAQFMRAVFPWLTSPARAQHVTGTVCNAGSYERRRQVLTKPTWTARTHTWVLRRSQ